MRTIIWVVCWWRVRRYGVSSELVIRIWRKYSRETPLVVAHRLMHREVAPQFLVVQKNLGIASWCTSRADLASIDKLIMGCGFFSCEDYCDWKRDLVKIFWWHNGNNQNNLNSHFTRCRLEWATSGVKWAENWTWEPKLPVQWERGKRGGRTWRRPVLGLEDLWSWGFGGLEEWLGEGFERGHMRLEGNSSPAMSHHSDDGMLGNPGNTNDEEWVKRERRGK